MFELVDNVPQSAVIKVIGVGGGGGNAVKHMIDNQIEGVDFICANTDAQALSDIASKTVLQLGGGVPKGLGAGADPEIGRQAAIEDRDRIGEALEGADMVFITAGMGGGTGTGGAPVVAEVAKEQGILTVAVVTRPFPFEGKKRSKIAEAGIIELEKQVDSVITIPNEKLLTVLGKGTTLLDAFMAANNVLLGAVQGIADLIIRPGMINVDFADVRTVMSEMGQAMMGTGEARGNNRAREAAESAIHSQLLEDVNLQGARGILVNITAGLDLSLGEFTEVGDTIEEFASDNATVVVGTVIDPDMADDIRVTVVATGLGERVIDRGLKVVDNLSSTQPGESVNYKEYEMPTVMRNPSVLDNPQPAQRAAAAPAQAAATSGSAAVQMADAETDSDMQYLDIPAFLRRQAD